VNDVTKARNAVIANSQIQNTFALNLLQHAVTKQLIKKSCGHHGMDVALKG
jgi:hypothetical protein